jgi:hypothetical protein
LVFAIDLLIIEFVLRLGALSCRLDVDEGNARDGAAEDDEPAILFALASSHSWRFMRIVIEWNAA